MLRITGIVRPADIGVGNIVPSGSVANFRIGCMGRGPATHEQARHFPAAQQCVPVVLTQESGDRNQGSAIKLIPRLHREKELVYRLLIATVALLAAVSQADAQVRIKDITDVAGARNNQLVGFGLVVGLDGTGSRSTFTQDVAVQMLQRMNFTTQIFSQLPAESVIRSTSIAAVMVTAEIGPFTRNGGRR